MLLACLPRSKTASNDGLELLTSRLDLKVLRLSNAYRIKRCLPLLDVLRNQDVDNLNSRKRKSLLKESVSASWQSPWDNSEKRSITLHFIRDVTFVENHTGLILAYISRFYLLHFYMKEAVPYKITAGTP